MTGKMNTPKAEYLFVVLSDVETKAKTLDTSRLMKTGFAKFDATYFGLAPQEFWIVGGYTSSGKSFYLLQTALNIINEGHKVLYFSLEMSSQSLASRMWANCSGLSAVDIEWGWLKIDEQNQKVFALETLKSVGENLMFCDQAYTVDQIKSVIKSAQDEGFVPELVIIDYLQNLISDTSEYEKLTSAAAQLQQLAKVEDVAILAASQLSNDEAKLGSSSKIIGFKGSGGLAASCDFALWLENQSDFNSENNQIIDLYVRKCRRGPKRKYQLVLKFPAGKMEEMA